MQNPKLPDISLIIRLSGDLQAQDMAEDVEDMKPLWDVELNRLEVTQSGFRCHFVIDNRAIVYEDRLEDRAANAGAVIGRAVRENGNM